MPGMSLRTSARTTLIVWTSLAICSFGFVGATCGADPPARKTKYARAGGYDFDGKISREVLENYLSRSITMEGLLNGRGDLKDNIRMLKSSGAKYTGRALCLWNAENNFLNNVKR